jgi:hypothetical protein
MHNGNVVKEQWKHDETLKQKARRRKVPGLCFNAIRWGGSAQRVSMVASKGGGIYDPYTHHAYHRLHPRI